ncbi:FeS assembly protein SufB/FeS assembly ATPase SufC [Bradyrhizobium sp. i1.3.6]
MPISEAIREHPELVQKYLGSVVPTSDNFYATLNSAVFSDGSFVYVPPGVRCPMELSTYFRINERNTGQFERTLIIADKGSYVSYLEGCTAPQRDENQLHAAVVELVAHDDAEIKYSTVQNWYPGNSEGKGGIYNFVTKRGDCRGDRSKISWTQVETGSAITWKYPSCILRGDNSSGEFYSIAISNGFQQVDSGTKMIHLGKNTSSRIISKGIAAGKSQNTYRGLVTAHRKATGARNFTACDSLLIGDKCGAHTVPYIEAKNSSATFEHEATTSKISEDVLFYCIQRGLSQEEAVGLVVNGFVKDVLQQLPMEFAVEAQKLISISLEGSVGLIADPRGALRRSMHHLNRLDTKMALLEVKDLKVRVEEREILHGLTLTVNEGEVHAIMGPNGSGKSTLSHVIAGKPGYEVTDGQILFKGEDLLEMDPNERAAKGVFLAFQYPVEIPGVATMTFLRTALNAQRKARGESEYSTPDFLRKVREVSKSLNIPQDMLKRGVNVGFSGGEKKRNEVLQMALFEPSLCILDEMDSGLDIDALRIAADGVNALRSPKRAMVVITHYQRLLNYIVPDVVHVMSKGRVVKSGGKDLALELEASGYAQFEDAA